MVSSSMVENDAIKAAIKVISKTNRMEDDAERAFDLYVISSDAERGQSLSRKTVTDDDPVNLPVIP
jgi:hypothetical protein